ncbi:MAG: PorT family protein [Prolixibacteraceae bacterium]|nr:PorT family protein [Prolixibacteraceae bacterium]MBN2650652.1 PorT family protein [Prolixibacteraceae bacterium]
MQNNGENIDQLFRNRLSGYEVSPPPNVWDNISATMAAKHKKRKAIWIWSLSSAASIALAFMLGWILSEKPSDYEALYAEIEKIKQNQNQAIILPEANEPKIELTLNQPKLLNTYNTTIHNNKSNSQTQHSRPTPNTQMALLTTLNARTEASVPANYQIIQLTSNTSQFSETDRAIIEANLLAMDDKNEKQSEIGYKHWAVGIKASPLSRVDELAMNDANYAAIEADYSPTQYNISTNYSTNLSAGLSVAYQAGKRLSFVSGINYNELTQTAENIALAFAGHNWTTYSDEAIYMTGTSAKNYAETEDLNTNTTTVLGTDLGKANIQLPPGVKLAKNTYRYSATAPATEGYNYQQNAGYIEVPFLMKYQLNDHKLGVHLTGGINTNILVSNNVNLSQHEQTFASGSIEGLRDITFSSSLGAGLNYNITKWLNFSIEPVVKIQLNSFSKLPEYDVRPYTFGVYSGLQYLF